ncbi:MAG: hypothetical protein PHW74_07375 [Desulfobacca sp.]|nr:hypothetical protein [Desulfobacca sp.]
MDLILIGSLASLLAGLATGAGALLVFVVRQVSDRFLDAALGFAAGVMLAAAILRPGLPWPLASDSKICPKAWQ